jgi:transcriptional regulator with XRE-family HTH domain
MEKNNTSRERINVKLRQARLKNLWTLQQAATKVDVSFSAFIRWERGQQQPSLVNLERLCNTFKTTPEELGYGHLIVPIETPSHASLSTESPNDSLASEMIPLTPGNATDTSEQIHQRLIALTKELFPGGFSPRIVRFQEGQKTLHVSCDAKVDKSVISSIKTEFRRRTGWTLGIQRVL